jgi:hypothetical protein
MNLLSLPLLHAADLPHGSALVDGRTFDPETTQNWGPMRCVTPAIANWAAHSEAVVSNQFRLRLRGPCGVQP